MKNKNLSGVGLKVAIVLIAAFYIAWRLIWKSDFQIFFVDKIAHCISNHLFAFSMVIVLMPLNWILEAYKWKFIASTNQKISMREALTGVLAGVTIGTATPNRVGEFAGRIFMMEGNRFELLQLSFIASFCQVFVTIVFGIIGFLVVGFSPQLTGSAISQYLAVGTGILICISPLFIRFLPEKWKMKIGVVEHFPKKILTRALFFSALRYLVYVSQFLILLFCFFPFYAEFFHLQTGFFLITISYFIITIIPTFSFTEVLVRGTVAGTVFAAYNSNFFDGVFDAAILLWAINVAIPSLIGSIFVFRLKFSGKEK